MREGQPWLHSLLYVHGPGKTSEGNREFQNVGPDRHSENHDLAGPGPLATGSGSGGQDRKLFHLSWSDFFIPAADAWRPEAWKVIRRTRNIIYQILTKRPENIPDRLPADWREGYPNVWLGASIENGRFISRRDFLIRIPAIVHFISAEPLLGPLSRLDLTDIEWLIVGGEGGPGFRSMVLDWPRELLAKARAARTAFFFKQSAAIRTEMGTSLGGKVYHEYPETGYQPAQAT